MPRINSNSSSTQDSTLSSNQWEDLEYHHPNDKDIYLVLQLYHKFSIQCLILPFDFIWRRWWFLFVSHFLSLEFGWWKMLTSYQIQWLIGVNWLKKPSHLYLIKKYYVGHCRYSFHKNLISISNKIIFYNELCMIHKRWMKNL